MKSFKEPRRSPVDTCCFFRVDMLELLNISEGCGRFSRLTNIAVGSSSFHGAANATLCSSFLFGATVVADCMGCSWDVLIEILHVLSPMA